MLCQIAFCHDGREMLSFSFVENKGQWDSNIKFRLEIPNGYMFFQKGGISYLFYHNPNAVEHAKISVGSNLRNRSVLPEAISLHALNISFDGGNDITPKPASPAGIVKYNYYLGKNPEKWALSSERLGSTILFIEMSSFLKLT